MLPNKRNLRSEEVDSVNGFPIDPDQTFTVSLDKHGIDYIVQEPDGGGIDIVILSGEDAGCVIMQD